MYMGHNYLTYIYEAFDQWYYYNLVGDSIGPFQEPEYALHEWKRYVRCDIEGKPSALDKLRIWWEGRR